MIPKIFQQWFIHKGWKLREHQREMMDAYFAKKSILLLAPTGSGKTLAGFLPVLIDLFKKPEFNGLHTIYISPLKALTNDIARNLEQPITDMNLPIKVEARTGDTSSYRKARQKKSPPHILLTTPESLALLLTYPDSKQLFNSLQSIIIDEIHSLAANKRGDHTSLLLARLQQLAPQARRVGLSATVADPKAMAAWLGGVKPAHIVKFQSHLKPIMDIIYSSVPLPLAGHYPSIALVQEIYNNIKSNKMTLVFANTRAQVERLFKDLWSINEQNLPIGIHHGSLTKELRLKVEKAVAEEQLRAVIATSSLDLGIDWGNVDIVLNVGAPKGISRLIQRIGRSNHRLDTPSRASVIPTNCFEAIECQAALQGIAEGVLDDSPPRSEGSLDILAQHIMSCACADPIEPNDLYKEVSKAYPYKHLKENLFLDTFNFVRNGGYVLENYERYHRLVMDGNGRFYPRLPRLKQRHRMNIGTIVEAEKLKVMLISNKSGTRRRIGKGVFLGDIEERLILGMEKGDTFLFAGQVLEYECVRDLTVEVKTSFSKTAKIPAFTGGAMPLSSYLGKAVLHLLATPRKHLEFPSYIQTWLSAQKNLSRLPNKKKLLVELFPHQGWSYLVAYTFQGRAVNQTLGFLLSHRLEESGNHALKFSVSDYGLSIWTVSPINESVLNTLWEPDFYINDLKKWLERSSMLKRFFRTTAVISGLIERKSPGQLKTGKQVTFSTDLIYDVLYRYDPGHLLLRSNRSDVERELIDLAKLKQFLLSRQGHIHYQHCKRITPFSIPIILETTAEAIKGKGVESLLRQKSIQERAADLYDVSLNG